MFNFSFNGDILLQECECKSRTLSLVTLGEVGTYTSLTFVRHSATLAINLE